MVTSWGFKVEESDGELLRCTQCSFWGGKRNIFTSVGFEVLTAVGTKMAVFWAVVPCSLVEIYLAASIIKAMMSHRPDDGGSKVL
jgi:hypothetical protein